MEEALVTKKTLRVEIGAKWVHDNLFLGNEGPSLLREDGQALKAEMLELLREIKKRRVVEVTETVLNEVRGRNVIKIVDIDTGEAFHECGRVAYVDRYGGAGIGKGFVSMCIGNFPSTYLFLHPL